MHIYVHLNIETSQYVCVCVHFTVITLPYPVTGKVEGASYLYFIGVNVVKFVAVILMSNSIDFGLLNQTGYSRGISIQFKNEEESRVFHCAFEQWKTEMIVQGLF